MESKFSVPITMKNVRLNANELEQKNNEWIQVNEDVALHSGYLFDYGIGGEKRKNCINNTFTLFNSRKIYPFGIDNKLTIKAGDSYSAVVWRRYIPRKRFNKNGIIASNVFVHNNKCYVYVDFNATGIYEVDIPESHIGKTFDVFEKSDNVELLTPISTKRILIKVSNSTPMYGYFVAKL